MKKRVKTLLSPVSVHRFIVPALACLVSAFYYWAVFSQNLTPWKGGGFGMFSTQDHTDTRILHCTGQVLNGNVIRINIEQPFQTSAHADALALAQAAPTDVRLQKIVDLLANLTYTHDSRSAYLEYQAQQVSYLDIEQLTSDSFPSWVRSLMAQDSPTLHSQRIQPTEIILQVYSIRFDQEHSLIRTFPTGKVYVSRK